MLTGVGGVPMIKFNLYSTLLWFDFLWEQCIIIVVEIVKRSFNLKNLEWIQSPTLKKSF